MRVEPTLLPIPENTTAVVNLDLESIVFIPNSYAGLKELQTNEAAMLEIGGEEYRAVADKLNLPESFDGAAQTYFVNRCIEVQDDRGGNISREGFAAIFESMMEDSISIAAIIVAIPNIISNHNEKRVQDIVDDAELQVAGLSDDERAGLAIGIITYEYNADYDRHYDVNGETMMLYCA